jgi:hypothetical protein
MTSAVDVVITFRKAHSLRRAFRFFCCSANAARALRQPKFRKERRHTPLKATAARSHSK